MKAGRPKKILDIQKLDSTQVVALPPEQAIESLLIFDVRCLDAGTKRELLRLLPQLIHIRRAWKAEFTECGCLACSKSDPRPAIAARLRERRISWDEVYDILGINRKSLDSEAHKRFENQVYWRLKHPLARERKPPTAYGAGGLCNACWGRIYQRMYKRYRNEMEGRNIPAEVEAFKDALCLSYNLAQRLFNGDEE
jgi:hypothetical protein